MGGSLCFMMTSLEETRSIPTRTLLSAEADERIIKQGLMCCADERDRVWNKR